jgi:hypothetical protein
MFNIGYYKKTIDKSEKEFAQRDVGLDQASRNELIRQGKSHLQLDEASESDGFQEGSLLDNLNQHREKQKIVSGTWVVKKSSPYKDIARISFSGHNYYLFDKNGRQVEDGTVQVMSEFIMLLPSGYNAEQKFIELIDRRYLVLECEGDRLEFEKTS